MLLCVTTSLYLTRSRTSEGCPHPHDFTRSLQGQCYSCDMTRRAGLIHRPSQFTYKSRAQTLLRKNTCSGTLMQWYLGGARPRTKNERGRARSGSAQLWFTIACDRLYNIGLINLQVSRSLPSMMAGTVLLGSKEKLLSQQQL